MNKLLKGSIAGAAGVALLLGGAGTFALWNDAASLDGGRIAAGTLTVETVGESTWTDQFGDIPDISTNRIAPGDSLTYKTAISVVAIGDNLSGELSIDPRSIVALGEATAENRHTALRDELVKNAKLTVSKADGSVISSADNTVTISPEDETNTYLVSVTINFPSGDRGDENAAKSGVVFLEDFGVTLNQVLLPVSVL